MKRIAIIGTTADSILNFRRELIIFLCSIGYEVHAFATDFSEYQKTELRNLGAFPVDYNLSRSGLNPFSDILTIWRLSRVLKKLRPDIAFSYFVKPSIYGTLAARLAGVPKRIAMIEGLGFVFTDLPEGAPIKQRVLRRVQVFLYRLSLPYAYRVIFLNPDDPVDLLDRNGIKVQRVDVLGGIGLNLNDYPFELPSTSPTRFIFVGRLLAEKGVFEYIEAARRVKSIYPEAEFFLLGGLDKENPGGLKESQLDVFLAAGVIKYPGHVDDVVSWISNSSVFVLPSYREGVPRSTQEAMAIGRAVITTDVPGCRETVSDEVNGFLVPKWDVSALEEKMIYLIENPSEITRMGKESHRIACEKFDVDKINRKLLSLIES